MLNLKKFFSIKIAQKFLKIKIFLKNFYVHNTSIRTPMQEVSDL
jgi:hypothetical protein